MTYNLLYLHNDPDYNRNIQWIEARGINVFTADTMDTACTVFQHNSIHLILLDLELKEENGVDFIRCLHEKGLAIPAIITTNALHEDILLEAINLDVTQCMIKPYTQQDLYDALKTATQKSNICHPVTYTHLNFGYTYDPISKHITSSEGNIIKLCNKESRLIELLLQNCHHITTYEMIENIVWEDSFMSIESLRTLIRGIREKTYKDIIVNINRIGYKINLPSPNS